MLWILDIDDEHSPEFLHAESMSVPERSTYLGHILDDFSREVSQLIRQGW